MTSKIFAYCERGLDPAFWAEPLNAATNLAFIIAALLGLRLWFAAPPASRGWTELGLVALVFVIGTGSFLFHTFAEPWAAAADTIPIGIFMVSYLAYALRRYLGWNAIAILAALVAFFIALWQSSVVRCGGGPCLNGSVAYFPAFLVLLVIGGVLMLRRHPAGGSLVAAGLLFAVSLTFRSIDKDICDQTAVLGADPLGTHFIWHVLNATLLYILVRAALRHGRNGVGKAG